MRENRWRDRLTQETVDLLNRVKEQILREPNSFIMKIWGARGTLLDLLTDDNHLDYSGRPTECGTAACIGGWMCVLSRLPILNQYAYELLGLQSNLAHTLFIVNAWPSDHRILWLETFTDPNRKRRLQKRARIACQVIDDFVEKYGPEPQKIPSETPLESPQTNRYEEDEVQVHQHNRR